MVITFRPKLLEDVKIDVISTSKLTKLSYQIISKGVAIISETVEVPNERKFQINFKATMAMVPRAHVVVYYVVDGEIISDSLDIEFEEDLKNFVSFMMTQRR